MSRFSSTCANSNVRINVETDPPTPLLRGDLYDLMNYY
ncbi:hypothetical protein CWATWH0003_0723 [Crocosphaera watsonii WH 0003]|uniref:Uncharacterized protein n=1 Tax=Crocosphaera watsonii WH 0003 TaxID=423471 RepID=G5IZN2_CROWT|nr:hypothetical protein CWATWH0003_0723 [Crocosphaera watsonii WH 0003]